MKKTIFFTLLFVAIIFASCNNSGNNEGNATDSTNVSESPKTTLKVTKQFVTQPDGSVNEYAVNVTIDYNEQEVKVNFVDSTEKSFSVKVVSFEKKVEGTLMKVTDGKYIEVFVSSGAKPQVTFTSDRGRGNMTFM